MKTWFISAFVFLVALAPSTGRAAPILDIGLQYKGLTESVVGDATNNFVTPPASIGAIGKSFSGSAQSSDGIVAAVIGTGPYSSVSTASSVSWTALFRVNQPDLTVEVILSFVESGLAFSTGWAYGSENTSVTLSLNGVQQLVDTSLGTSCNTAISDCQNVSANSDRADIILSHLIVGEMIDISGYLSAGGSGTAGRLCLPDTICLGGGGGTATADFSVDAIPEPPVLPLFGAGLLLVGIALRRPRLRSSLD